MRVCAGLFIMAGVLLLSFSDPVLAQDENALEFNGINDFVVVATTPIAQDEFTVEAWILARDASVVGDAIVANNENRASEGFELIVRKTGGDFVLEMDFGLTNVVQAPFGTYIDQWTHVAATWDGSFDGTVVLFINGQVAATGTGTMGDATARFFIGRVDDTTPLVSFDGMIDEVRVWEVAMNEDLIDTWKGAVDLSAHPRYNDLQAFWRFQEGSGQTVESEVNVGTFTGQLGSTPGVDLEDPGWGESGGLPVESATWGGVKSLYR